jgi:hypothetical protein
MTHTTEPTKPRRDNRIPNTARGLGCSRAVARSLLAIPHDLRLELLAEVTRVGAHRVLAFTRTQPTAAPTM